MKKIETNEITPEIKSSLRTRIISALVLAAIIGPALFIGDWFFFFVVLAFAICASYELVHVMKLQTKTKYFIGIAAMVLMLSFIYWIFIKNNISNFEEANFDNILINNFNDLLVSTVLILVAAGVFFFISFVEEEFTVQHVCYLLAMTIIVALCFQSFLYLRYSPFEQFKNAGVDTSTGVFKYAQSAFLIIYVVLGTISTDIGAYFVGILFGKHKLNPRISPKKTWEGFFGGIIFSCLVSLAWAFFLDLGGYPILPSLDLNHWYWVLLISAVMPIIANLGDFAFSAIKRSYGIKDFSKIIPGHGGVLDRIDSVLFTCGFVSVMLVFINSGWEAFTF